MKQPHWVMCMVCSEILYAGPSIYPIPRECQCQATRVVPTDKRGYVQWDADRYKAAARVAGDEAANAFLRELGEAEATKLKSMGFSEKEVIQGTKQAIREARPQAEKVRSEAYASAPSEPEVEYTEEQLRPDASVQIPYSPSIDELYQSNMEQLERGEIS